MMATLASKTFHSIYGTSEERRDFSAEFAGSIWYGDVMHGPRVPHKGQLRKVFLVSLFDDASRLVAHQFTTRGVVHRGPTSASRLARNASSSRFVAGQQAQVILE